MQLLSWRRLFAAAAAADEQLATKCANGCGCGAPVSEAGSRRRLTIVRCYSLILLNRVNTRTMRGGVSVRHEEATASASLCVYRRATSS